MRKIDKRERQRKLAIFDSCFDNLRNKHKVAKSRTMIWKRANNRLMLMTNNWFIILLKQTRFFNLLVQIDPLTFVPWMFDFAQPRMTQYYRSFLIAQSNFLQNTSMPIPINWQMNGVFRKKLILFKSCFASNLHSTLLQHNFCNKIKIESIWMTNRL